MKEKLMRSFNRLKNSPSRGVKILILVILLVMVFGAIYTVQNYRSRAQQTSATPLFIRTTRVSSTVGKVQFETDIPVLAQITCSKLKESDYEPCGTDIAEATSHDISTDGSGFLLNPSIGYYVKIITGTVSTLTYIPSDEKGAAFGYTLNSFDNSVIGSCRGEGDYDPAFDFNQDGCVNLNDAAEIY